MASGQERPSARAAARASVKVSPAPMVLATATGRPGFVNGGAPIKAATCGAQRDHHGANAPVQLLLRGGVNGAGSRRHVGCCGGARVTLANGRAHARQRQQLGLVGIEHAHQGQQLAGQRHGGRGVQQREGFACARCTAGIPFAPAPATPRPAAWQTPQPCKPSAPHRWPSPRGRRPVALLLPAHGWRSGWRWGLGTRQCCCRRRQTPGSGPRRCASRGRCTCWVLMPSARHKSRPMRPK